MSRPRMQQVIYKAKNNNTFKCNIDGEFESIKQLGEYISNNNVVLKHSVKNISYSIDSYLLDNKENGCNLIFYDNKLMNAFNNNNDIFIDATYKVVPRRVKGCMQMLTVMARKNGVVCIV